MITAIEIEDLFFKTSKVQGVILTDITLQVTEEKGKLIVEDINKHYYVFVNLDYIVAGKSLFIQLPNGRSLTLKIV